MNNNNFSSFLTAESLIGMLVIFKLVILIAVPQLALCRGRNRWVSIAEICERLLSSPTAMLVFQVGKELHRLYDEPAETLVFKKINSKLG